MHIYLKMLSLDALGSLAYKYQRLNGALYPRQVHRSVRTADPPGSDRQLWWLCF